MRLGYFIQVGIFSVDITYKKENGSVPGQKKVKLSSFTYGIIVLVFIVRFFFRCRHCDSARKMFIYSYVSRAQRE